MTPRAHIVMGVDGVERLHRQRSHPPCGTDHRGRRTLSGDGEGNTLRLTMADDGSHLVRTSRDDQPLRVASRVRGIGRQSPSITSGSVMMVRLLMPTAYSGIKDMASSVSPLCKIDSPPTL